MSRGERGIRASCGTVTGSRRLRRWDIIRVGSGPRGGPRRIRELVATVSPAPTSRLVSYSIMESISRRIRKWATFGYARISASYHRPAVLLVLLFPRSLFVIPLLVARTRGGTEERSRERATTSREHNGRSAFRIWRPISLGRGIYIGERSEIGIGSRARGAT